MSAPQVALQRAKSPLLERHLPCLNRSFVLSPSRDRTQVSTVPCHSSGSPTQVQTTRLRGLSLSICMRKTVPRLKKPNSATLPIVASATLSLVHQPRGPSDVVSAS